MNTKSRLIQCHYTEPSTLFSYHPSLWSRSTLRCHAREAWFSFPCSPSNWSTLYCFACIACTQTEKDSHSWRQRRSTARSTKLIGTTSSSSSMNFFRFHNFFYDHMPMFRICEAISVSTASLVVGGCEGLYLTTILIVPQNEILRYFFHCSTKQAFQSNTYRRFTIDWLNGSPSNEVWLDDVEILEHIAATWFAQGAGTNLRTPNG